MLRTAYFFARLNFCNEVILGICVYVVSIACALGVQLN